MAKTVCGDLIIVAKQKNKAGVEYGCDALVDRALRVSRDCALNVETACFRGAPGQKAREAKIRALRRAHKSKGRRDRRLAPLLEF